MTNNNKCSDIIIDIEPEFGSKNEVKAKKSQSIVYKVIKAFGIMAVGMMAVFGAVNYYEANDESNASRNILMDYTQAWINTLMFQKQWVDWNTKSDARKKELFVRWAGQGSSMNKIQFDRYLEDAHKDPEVQMRMYDAWDVDQSDGEVNFKRFKNLMVTARLKTLWHIYANEPDNVTNNVMLKYQFEVFIRSKHNDFDISWTEAEKKFDETQSKSVYPKNKISWASWFMSILVESITPMQFECIMKELM